MRLSVLEDATRGIQADVAEIKIAILGDLHGFKGIRQKTDEAYEEMLVIKEDHRGIKQDVQELKQTNFKRQGMLVGIGLIGGTTFVELLKKFGAWIGKP